MTRTITAMTAMLAASLMPQVSHAAPCAAPASQNCTFMYEGEWMRCDLFVGTATPPGGSWACIDTAGSGTIHIGL